MSSSFHDTTLVPSTWGFEKDFLQRESVSELISRVVRFRRWITKQTHKCVLLVGHHDFFATMTNSEASLGRGEIYPGHSWTTLGELLIPPERVWGCNETESAARCLG